MPPDTHVPIVFFILSLLGAMLTLSALARLRYLKYLNLLHFFCGWLTGELALFHIVWQVPVVLLFIANGALAYWTGQFALLVTIASWAGLVVAFRLGNTAGKVFETALTEELGSDYRNTILPERRSRLREDAPLRAWVCPFKMKAPGVKRISNISYGDAGVRNLLDIYCPTSISEEGCPTLLQIHGGGWTIGNKNQQALPLMYHLAARGWICVAANYRLSPRFRFPAHLMDVKRALAWIKEHGAKYGADPAFVAVTGGSAGGHLSALVALTANQAELQPGFEEADTSVAACVPFYGVYDFVNLHKVAGDTTMQSFLAKNVMPCRPEEDPAIWELASPVTHVHGDAPPFFVIHGTHDSLLPLAGARSFVEALKAASHNPVVYAEVPGAQHAFEIFHSVRCEHAVNAVARFLEYIYATHKG